MALFNKFFFSSSNKKKSNSNLNQIKASPHFPLDSNQVRILLYRECDANGRRLLFDSSSIQKVAVNENEKQNTRPNLQATNNKFVGNIKNHATKSDPLLNDASFIEISNGIGYKHVRPTASDITNIGEMVFGALAMSFRSPSLKVHWLSTPSRLLCSQVFLSPVSGKHTGCLLNQTDLLGSASNSNNNLSPKQKLKKQSSESFDGYSVNSFSSPFSPLETNNRSLSIQLSALPVINDTNFTKNTLNIQCDQIELNKITTTQSLDETTTATTTPTIGSDSGYAATISDCWTSRSSYQYSTRSSMGSVLSDPLSTYDSLRKFSLESGKSNYGEGCGGAINSSFGSTSFSMSLQQNPKINDMCISRRIIRNIQTSFENRNSICDFVGFITDNYQQTTATNGGSDGCVSAKYKIQRPIDLNESHSNPEIRKKILNSSSNNLCNILEIKKSSSKCSKTNPKRSKLGLAVCISMSESHEKEMEEFCCEHIALIESMLFRLRASVEYAYLNHKKFLKIMLHAWQKTVEWILDFFTVPRLTIPLWFNLTSIESKSTKQMADHFIKEFCCLLKTSDAKDTNFFFSTMITAVLTHHLGWVSTVTSTPSNTTETINEIANEKQKNLRDTAIQYPYNPLWAQMCDLYGAIGHPPKISRTIICGKDKNLIEKFLNVLTYFIRCSEIHRNNIKKEIKIEFNERISYENKTKFENNEEKPKKKSGLFRTTTIHKNLHEIFETDTNESKNKNYNVASNSSSKLYNSKITENHLLLSKFNHDPYKNYESKEKIKFTVTTPEDIEMALDDETFSIYTNSTTATDECEALEAIEIQENSELNFISRLEPPDFNEKVSFWKFEPIIKEGISWLDVMKIQKDVKVKEWQNETTNQHLLTENNVRSFTYGKASRPQDKNISLSDLITENSVGKSERFVWGIEPVKENICLEEEKHFEVSQKLIEKDRNFSNSKNEIVNQEKGKGVLFVLGDNEHLVNIKKGDENLSSNEEIPKNEIIVENHPNKKQSGVKFNLEEYSESVTSFLSKKSNFESKLKYKNFQLQKSPKMEKFPIIYDFWTKCTCDSNNDISSTSLFSIDLNKNKSESDAKNQKTLLNTCEFCKSNTEEININKNNLVRNETSNDISEKTQLSNTGGTGAYRKPAVCGNSPIKKLEFKDENISCLPISSRGLQLKKMFQNLKEKNKKFELINLKHLPIPDVTISNENIHSNNDKKIQRTGFIPSLFVGVSDRYISDMVLQGTVLPFSKWETNIKNDLTIASHCASLISQPTENIAIIADMDKWEIKILSSQSNILPYTCSSNGPVGMSQLVSQFLEGLYVMSNSGISSYDCLAYLESKLREIYLQSEALAGLLLTTEFCSLSSVTAALNLSENDVPLLLAIASIHSPQVTKRYGISFG